MRKNKREEELLAEIEQLKTELNSLQVSEYLARREKYSLGAAISTVLDNPFVVPEMTTIENPNGTLKVVLKMDLSFEQTLKLQEFFEFKRRNIQIGEDGETANPIPESVFTRDC